MNPNHAELVQVSVREPERMVWDQASATRQPACKFHVIVEAKAGNVLGASAQPYTLSLYAFDFTAGTNPHSPANTFTQQRAERFDSTHGWPDKVTAFTVVLKDPDAVAGHLLKCFVTLTSTNQIASFVESPLFLLHLDAPYPAVDGPESEPPTDRVPLATELGHLPRP
jgi:hypothetical protein